MSAKARWQICFAICMASAVVANQPSLRGCASEVPSFAGGRRVPSDQIAGERTIGSFMFQVRENRRRGSGERSSRPAEMCHRKLESAAGSEA